MNEHDIFSIIPIEVFMDDRLTKTDLRVLGAILSWRNKTTNLMWPKRSQISARCNLSLPKISTSTTHLVELGWLKKEGKGGYSRATHYQFCVPDLVDNNDVINQSPNKTVPDSGTVYKTVPDSGTVFDTKTVPDSGTKTVPDSGTKTVPDSGTRKEQTSEHKGEHKLKDIVKFDKSSDMEEVFDYWKITMDCPRAKLDDKRKNLIVAALKTGYSVDELKSAILGCSFTPHNIGMNDKNTRYDQLHVILKDAGQIDRFIKNSINPPNPMQQNNGFTHYPSKTEQQTNNTINALLGLKISAQEISHEN